MRVTLTDYSSKRIKVRNIASMMTIDEDTRTLIEMKNGERLIVWEMPEYILGSPKGLEGTGGKP